MDTNAAGPILKIVCWATAPHEGHLISFFSLSGKDGCFSLEFDIVNINTYESKYIFLISPFVLRSL